MTTTPEPADRPTVAVQSADDERVTTTVEPAPEPDQPDPDTDDDDDDDRPRKGHRR